MPRTLRFSAPDPPQQPEDDGRYEAALRWLRDTADETPLEDAVLVDTRIPACPHREARRIRVERCPCPVLNARGATIRDVMVRGGDFSNAEMGEVALRRASIADCKAVGVSLAGAHLLDVLFSGVKLSMSFWLGAKL